MELERKVDVIMKGLNVLLFDDGEVLAEDEIRDLKQRLEDYVARQRRCLFQQGHEFVSRQSGLFDYREQSSCLD